MLKKVQIQDQLQLAVYETPGTKGTIIAVHGLTGNHKTFIQYRKYLEQDYRFISYDMRGRGDSSPADEETSLFQHAEDLQTFIKEQNIVRPILMGYSMGAYICAQIASKIDVEALILLDGAGTTEERQRALIVPSLNRLKRKYKSQDDYVDQTRQIYDSLYVKWDEDVEEITRYEVEKKADGYHHKSQAAVMEKDFNSFYDFNPVEVFDKISCPVFLVIAYGKLGLNDPLFTQGTYIETVMSAKDITTIEIPANHYTLMFGKQPVVEENLMKFLNKIG